MIAATLLLPIHPCISVDLHHNLPPPPAPPVPLYLPYFWLQILGGLPFFNKVKMAKKTYAWHFPALQKDTDIGGMLVHVGNPINLKLPLIIYKSSSKSHFGASTVKIENEIVATSSLIFVNHNMNCGNPCNLPTGIVVAPNTVMAGMTIGDYISGTLTIVIDASIGYGMDKLGKGISAKINDKISKSAIGKAVWETVIKGKDTVGKRIEKSVKKGVSYSLKEGLKVIKEAIKNNTKSDDYPEGINPEAIGKWVDKKSEGTGAQEVADAYMDIKYGPLETANEGITSGMRAIGDFFSGGEQL